MFRAYSTLILGLILAVTAISQPKAKEAELTLTKCWAYPLGDKTGVRIASDGERVFAGTDGGGVVALSIDGKKLWSAELGGEISSRLVATPAGVYLTTTAVKADGSTTGDSVLYSLSKETGITNWSVKVPSANVHFLKAWPQGLVISSAGGEVQSIDAKNGATIWTRQVEVGIELEPTVTGTELLIASGHSQLNSVSLATGNVTSTENFPIEVTAMGRSSDGSLNIGNDRGVLSSFDAIGKGAKWTFRSGGAISSIVPLEHWILFASHDNFLYLISTREGHVSWRRRLPGRVTGIEAFSDRWAVVEGSEEHAPLLIVDLDKGKTAGQIPVGPDESVADRPVILGNTIVFITGAAAYAYGSKNCAQTNESGPTTTVKPLSKKK